MAKFLSGRQKNIRIGISSYSENLTSLEVIGKVGIGTTNAGNYSLYVVGDTNISGIVSATTFVGALTGTATSTTNIPNLTGAITSNNTTTSLGSFTSANLSAALTDETGTGSAVFATSPVLVTPSLGIATALSLVVSGVSTLATLHAPKLTNDGSDFGSNQYIIKSNGSGGWSWFDVPGLFSVNNILNGFIVSEEGSIVGTAGSITQLDFRGNNIVATASSAPNGIATVRVSDTPSFTSLNVSGISTLGTVKISSGIITSSNPGVSTVVYYGDGSNLQGVNAFNVINQDIISSPVFPTFASNIGVSSVGISTTNLVFVPASGRLGIGTTNPQSTLQVGTAITMYGSTGIVSATAFYGDGSNLQGVNAFNVINQDIISSPVFPTFASNVGVSSVGISTTNLVFVPASGNLGLGSTNPTSKLHVVGNGLFTGVVTATTFIGNINFGSTGSISIGNTTGSSGQYLQSSGIGVTWATFPTLRTTQTNTATAGQTSFGFSYNVNFLDVYVNGVKLTSSEYVASNGSSITLISPAFVNDIVEFISYNTTSVGGGGGGGASIIDDLSDVNLNLPPAAGENLTYDGYYWVNDYVVTATTTTTSQTTLHSLSSSSYRSVEYMIQATQGSNYHVTKIIAIHDGTTTYPTEYGTLYTNGSLGTFDVDISGGNIRLRVTPSSSSSTSYKIKFTAIKV